MIASKTLRDLSEADPQQKGLLLLVDDEALNVDMLSRRLERSGFSVKTASSGSGALRMLGEHSFDLILLDQMMPGMSGSEVLQAIREELSPEALPVIMVTAIAEGDKIIEALESGANDYITKPVDYKIALARIRSQLARKHADQALRQSEERYALAARASRDGLWDWNLLTGIVYYSPRWKQMLGLDQGVEENAEAWFSRVVGADRQVLSDTVEQHLKGLDDVLQCEFRMRHVDGSLLWMSCRGITIRNAEGVPVRMAGSQSDITNEKTRDVLTGLPNRLLLVSQLEFAIDAATTALKGGPGSSVHGTATPAGYAVLFLDLDGFKAINDSLGHVAGDYLLKGIAARLRLACESWSLQPGLVGTALPARMGGDEFAILLEGEVTEESVRGFASEVRRLMKDPFDLEGTPVRCVFSIGIALQSTLHDKPEDVLREADTAMYAAKAQQLGQTLFFDQGMRDAANERFELETDIRSAVQAGELEIAYQPKVNLATRIIYGVEALVRWNHPKRGLLQPGTFIPIAEETGAIVEIGRWILHKACQQMMEWNEQFPAGARLELSINLSPREFRQERLIEEIKRTLFETGFPSCLLHLEITEGALFEDLTAARATLYALKQIGVRLDIDDFGTGYSSLKYLSELPFDTLKIDQYFTASLDSGQPLAGELIRTIVHMADHLGLQVVAEGIENEGHSSVLQLLGCRLGQGYYYSKPVSAADLAKLLAAERSVPVRNVRAENPLLSPPPTSMFLAPGQA